MTPTDVLCLYNYTDDVIVINITVLFVIKVLLKMCMKICEVPNTHPTSRLLLVKEREIDNMANYIFVKYI